MIYDKKFNLLSYISFSISIINNFNWNIIDGGLSIDCNETKLEEQFFTNEVVKKIDILGREAAIKGYQLHIYDDGSIEKKYLIK